MFTFWKESGDMTLKELEAFYWAATAASFQVASERLHISQSALSKRISELEAHFRKPLFDRSSHRAALTPAGRRLLPFATRLLKMSSEVNALLADDAGMFGHCRFGVGELAALTWLPDFVRHIGERFPHLSMEPCIDVGSSLERRLHDGELDFAVVAGHPTQPGIVGHAIAEVHFSWAASKRLIGNDRVLSPEFLSRHPLITMPHGAGPTRMLEYWLTANGLEATSRMTCNNLSAVASLIAAGLGVGLFPDPWLTALSRKKGVVALQGPAELPPMLYTFQHRYHDPRPMLTGMLDAVKSTVDFTKPCSLW